MLLATPLGQPSATITAAAILVRFPHSDSDLDCGKLLSAIGFFLLFRCKERISRMHN